MDQQQPIAPRDDEREPAPIAVLLKGYPRLSETFIAQEIRALEQAGLRMRLYSMRFPTDKARHPVHDEIEAPVAYLPEYLYQEPLRVLRGWWVARRRPGYKAARSAFFRHLKRDPTPNRIRRFGQAMVLTAELPKGIRHIHVHFLHTPASVADYATIMDGRTWSFSAHAKDIWTTPAWEKHEKLERAQWGVTCTAIGCEHLRDLAPDAKKTAVHLAYHGVDLDRFPAPPDRASNNRGDDPERPLIIASVGRAVAKKGYDTLVDALSMLPHDLNWEFQHIGGGTESDRLKARAEQRGIADRITWMGACPQRDVIALLRRADIFALASQITKSGDRDGLPNVLMEAQSQELACIASDVAAIPELIIDRETGVLVPPGDPSRLAAALDRTMRDPALRERLGAAGRERLERKFDFARCMRRILPLFGVESARARKTLAAE